jgi:hypothetical protein
MTSKSPEEMAALKAEGGDAAVRAYYEAEAKAVFGFDYKTDKDGKILEQGIGSPANPSINSIRAYEKYCKDEPGFPETLARLKREFDEFQAKKSSRQRA